MNTYLVFSLSNLQDFQKSWKKMIEEKNNVYIFVFCLI